MKPTSITWMVRRGVPGALIDPRTSKFILLVSAVYGQRRRRLPGMSDKKWRKAQRSWRIESEKAHRDFARSLQRSAAYQLMRLGVEMKEAPVLESPGLRD